MIWTFILQGATCGSLSKCGTYDFQFTLLSLSHFHSLERQAGLRDQPSLDEGPAIFKGHHSRILG